MSSKQRKYRIYELLMRMPGSEFVHARKFLINKIGITHQTLQRWERIPSGCDYSIPGDALRTFAQFFNTSIEELHNDTEIINVRNEFINSIDDENNYHFKGAV